jgi:hypothetical protein
MAPRAAGNFNYIKGDDLRISVRGYTCLPVHSNSIMALINVSHEYPVFGVNIIQADPEVVLPLESNHFSALLHLKAANI